MAGLTKRRIEADRGRVTTDVAGVSGLIVVMCQPEFPECEPHILFIDQKSFGRVPVFLQKIIMENASMVLNAILELMADPNTP